MKIFIASEKAAMHRAISTFSFADTGHHSLK